MGKRRKARELALQVLYRKELNPDDPSDLVDIFWENEDVDGDINDFFRQLVRGTLEKKEQIDEMITKQVKNWDMNRLSIIDRNIIRLAAFEMIFLSQSAVAENSIPHAVSINEAVEIAKKYSTPDSGKFVNGVLDQIRKEFLVKPGEKDL